ncbi:MAG: MlaD family protein [Verrucomicrobiales bacterium]|jgi:phospholipid/cholesterol/gamma-HCH transport system substrate-binding protein|nr:MlaD family protein [Verrucomicrobiales bacterium]
MNERTLEIKVGAFVLAGLIAIGVLTVAFGRFGELFAHDYEITVSFPNASGIIKNSQVLYRGARVGKVARRPAIINRGQAVELALKIRSDIRIPANSTFRIGAYGLLGDRFVDIITPDQPADTWLTNGQRVGEMQQNQRGLGDLAAQAQPIMRRLDDISTKIDQQLMNEDTLRNLQDAIANAKSVSARVDAFMAQAERGQGTLSLLLNDRQTADDVKLAIRQFKELSRNLKEHGILFYRDTADKEPARPKKK